MIRVTARGLTTKASSSPHTRGKSSASHRRRPPADGLGTELLTRLSGRARSAGICRFTALVAEDNIVMAGLLRNISANPVGRNPGAVEYEITLGVKVASRKRRC